MMKKNPTPQQQPIKPQTTTQHKKQTHDKPPKKSHTKKPTTITKQKTHKPINPKQQVPILQIQNVYRLLANKYFQTVYIIRGM
jgi:hypothetical protein